MTRSSDGFVITYVMESAIKGLKLYDPRTKARLEPSDKSSSVIPIEINSTKYLQNSVDYIKKEEFDKKSQIPQRIEQSKREAAKSIEYSFKENVFHTTPLQVNVAKGIARAKNTSVDPNWKSHRQHVPNFSAILKEDVADVYVPFDKISFPKEEMERIREARIARVLAYNQSILKDPEQFVNID